MGWEGESLLTVFGGDGLLSASFFVLVSLILRAHLRRGLRQLSFKVTTASCCFPPVLTPFVFCPWQRRQVGDAGSKID